MAFVIGLLTFVIVLDCLLLILLVLMQLPKKEAGAGLAFGGAATDALFGAGSGNFLTKATKYVAIIFFGLSMVLSVMQSRYFHRSGSAFLRNVQEQEAQPTGGGTPTPKSAPGTPSATTESSGPSLTNLVIPQAPTNAPARVEPATNNTPATATQK